MLTNELNYTLNMRIQQLQPTERKTRQQYLTS